VLDCPDEGVEPPHADVTAAIAMTHSVRWMSRMRASRRADSTPVFDSGDGLA
jgi:hypothetical protein